LQRQVIGQAVTSIAVALHRHDDLLTDVTAKTVIFESYADARDGALIQINEPSGMPAAGLSLFPDFAAARPG